MGVKHRGGGRRFINFWNPENEGVSGTSACSPDLRNLFTGLFILEGWCETMIFYIPYLFVRHIAIWPQPGQNR